MSLANSVRATTNRASERFREDVRSPRGIAVIVGLLASLAVPLLVDGYFLNVYTQMLIFIVAVASWNLIAGYLGVFSFAHAAFFGIGAYTTAILTAEVGLPPEPALVLGGVAAALFAIPISLPVLRLGGAYVAMVTLAYAEIIYLASIIFRDVTGGPTGYTAHSGLFGGDHVLAFYYTLVIIVLLMAVLYLLTVSRFGLIAKAIRESEDAAMMLGNNTYRYKLVGFVVGSGVAGVAGGLQAFNLLIVSPPMLDIDRMIEFMAMGIIGGLGTFAGPIIGVIVVVGISEILRGWNEARLLIWGILLLVIILFYPNGLAGSDVQKQLLRKQIDSVKDLVPGRRRDND